MTRRLAGAPLVCAGIVLTLVAGAIQASSLRVRLIVPFDHNGLFHLVQIVATAVIAIGVRRGFEAKTPLLGEADRSGIFQPSGN